MRLQVNKVNLTLCVIIILSFSLHLTSQDYGIRFPDNDAPWCVITGVVPGSFADSLGLMRNDIILSINGVPIHSNTDLRAERETAAGSDIEMDVWRNGTEISLQRFFPGGGFGIYTVYVDRGKTLNIEEMKEDLDSLFAFIYEVHPDPYASFPESEFRSEKEHLYASIQEEITDVEFWKPVARFVAKIQDGHTGLFLPIGDWNYKRFSGEPVLFPFSVLITRQGVYIEQNMSPAPVSPGDRILSINDREMDTLLAYLEQYRSGELRHFRLSQIENHFHQLIYQIAGIEPPFEVTVRSVDGAAATYVVDGIDWRTMEEATGTTPGIVTELIELPELSTAVLRFNQFGVHLPGFFRSSFATIQEKRYKYVVIDLQHNGGGNSAFADTLLSYITDKPYRFFGGAHIKISRFVLPQSPAFGYHDVGSVVKYPGSEPSRPPGRQTRFDGEIFCLISNRTFSTASGFAAVLKDFEIGTLIGEETGGIPTTFGDVAIITLPNSSIAAGASMKFFIRPGGDPSYVMEGVQPDIEVPVTGLDILKGRDPVLETVKRIIEKELHR